MPWTSSFTFLGKSGCLQGSISTDVFLHWTLPASGAAAQGSNSRLSALAPSQAPAQGSSGTGQPFCITSVITQGSPASQGSVPAAAACLLACLAQHWFNSWGRHSHRLVLSAAVFLRAQDGILKDLCAGTDYKLLDCCLMEPELIEGQTLL
jgi:hypothetical protein